VLASPLVWRVAWQLWPGLIVCALFWLAALRWGINRFHETDLAWSRRFMLLSMVGLGLNATVTLANGGYMPVLDDTVSRSVWVTATDSTRLCCSWPTSTPASVSGTSASWAACWPASSTGAPDHARGRAGQR
jgi:hypothetical protein